MIGYAPTQRAGRCDLIPPYKYHTQLTQRKRTYPMNSADNEAIQNQRTRAVKTRKYPAENISRQGIFSYIAYLSNLLYHRITKQSGGCYNGKIHNGRTHRIYELVGDYYLVAGDEEPELEPIGIYGQRHRRYLSLQRISEVPCSFVGVTFAFLFVESRVFSSFTPCGAAGAPRLPARYCGQRGLSGGWQG